MGSVLALEVERAIVEELRLAAGALEDLAVEVVAGPADAIARLAQGSPTVEALVLGPSVAEPVRIAQRACSVSPELPILILGEPERVTELERAVQFAPFLGGSVRCRAADDGAAVARVLRDAVDQGRARQRYRATLEVLNAQLAAAQASAQQPLAAAYLDRLLDHVPVGVVAVDLAGEVLAWNAWASALFERSEREALGASLPELFSGRARERWNALLAGCEAPGAGAATEVLERRLRDGREQHVEVIAAPIRGRTGERGALLIFHDVTARVLADRARASVEEERARLIDELREAVSSRDDFLSIAAHELRTPLTSLTLQIQRFLVAARAEGAAPRPSQLESVDRSLSRLGRLIDDLLDVSRLRVGRLEIDREDVDLAALTRDVVDRHAADISRARCAVAVHAPEPVVGRWDRPRLDQIITNLVSNAIKYGQGGLVEISVRREGVEGRLSVRDHGIGIDAGEQARIFERFERAVSSRNYGGLGLGLWIVRQLVEAHGGRISVESRQGEGALFAVELPLAER